jgi:hypothetical protein
VKKLMVFTVLSTLVLASSCKEDSNPTAIIPGTTLESNPFRGNWEMNISGQTSGIAAVAVDSAGKAAGTWNGTNTSGTYIFSLYGEVTGDGAVAIQIEYTAGGGYLKLWLLAGSFKTDNTGSGIMCESATNKTEVGKWTAKRK